jgi:beta-galactosidase
VGTNFHIMTEWIHENDPTRPVHYYALNYLTGENENEMVDVYSMQGYGGPGVVPQFAPAAKEDGQPFFMNEYAHAMGNSQGNFAAYWEHIDANPIAQGAWIWDWVNQAVSWPTPTLVTTPDESENDLTGEVTAEIVDGVEGNAVNGYVTLPSVSALDITSEGLTLEAWVMPHQSADLNEPFITKGDQQYSIKQKGDKIEFFVYKNGWNSVQVRLPDNWYGEWHHVAGTYDGSVLSLYVDGELRGTREYSGAIASTSYPVNIGRNAQYTGRVTNSSIDAVRIYDRALSAEELGDSNRSPGDSTQLWMDFNEFQKKEHEQDSFFSYGGDWQADYPNSDNFCVCGMISPDRDIQPGIWDVKKVHQDIDINPIDVKQGTIEVSNNHRFTNLRSFVGQWMIKENGEPLQSGTLSDVDIAAGKTQKIEVPFEKPALQPGAEYWLDVSFTLSEDTRWAPEDHEVATEQFEIPYEVPEPTERNLPMRRLRVNKSDGTITVNGGEFRVIFDTQQGTIDSYEYRGREIFRSGPVPNFWRAPTDNDRGSGYTAEIETWRNAGSDRTVENVEITERKRTEVRIVVDATLPTAPNTSRYETTFTIYSSGEIEVENTLQPGDNLPDIPVIGTQLTIPTGFENMSWYGRGPHENYWDRKESAFVGRYESTVDEQFTPYLECQETGNLTDVRWVRLTNDIGFGIEAEGSPVVEASALHYTTTDLENSKHPYELTHTDITFSVNHKQMGVGDNSFVSSGRPLEQFRIHADQPYSYSYTLRPVSPGNRLYTVPPQ